jgi:membrane associated rhomboid family serine protease
MQLNRLRPGDWLTGLSGVALILLLFAPWYTVGDGIDSGWKALGYSDVWFAIAGILAICVWVSTARRDAPAVPLFFLVVTVTWSAVALILVIVRLLAVPGGEAITGRDWGVFVGALAVLGVFAGSLWALRDERAPGIRRSPEARTFTVPAAGAGPRAADADS